MDAEDNLRVGVREFRGKLTYYLGLARDGATILITSHDVVVAEIGPPRPSELPPRKGGMLKGQIRMADDFDTWPEDVLESFETGKF